MLNTSFFVFELAVSSSSKSDMGTHTLPSKLTPVSGCAVQANSVVAHFVSISVSVNGSRKKTTRSDKEEQGDVRYQ